MLAAVLLALLAQPTGLSDVAPFEGEATLEACLTQAGARDHSACWPILEAEIALAPDGLFNTAHATSPGRLEGWLGAVCAPERLEAGQTDAECRTQAQERLERSRAARRVMGPATNAADVARYQGLRGAVSEELARREAAEADPFDTGVDVEAGFRLDPPSGAAREPDDADDRDQDRCQRRESSWRDADTGDASSSYSVTCALRTGDPENDRAAREALDAVMGWD